MAAQAMGRVAIFLVRSGAFGGPVRRSMLFVIQHFPNTDMSFGSILVEKAIAACPLRRLMSILP